MFRTVELGFLMQNKAARAGLRSEPQMSPLLSHGTSGTLQPELSDMPCQWQRTARCHIPGLFVQSQGAFEPGVLPWL